MREEKEKYIYKIRKLYLIKSCGLFAQTLFFKTDISGAIPLPNLPTGFNINSQFLLLLFLKSGFFTILLLYKKTLIFLDH